MEKKNKLVHYFILGVFVLLYAIVSIISTIHVVDFFEMANPKWLAISLAIAFEIGAAASLASIIIMEKTSKGLVWMLFFILTGMQMMGNMYHGYTNLHEYQSWVELFGVIDWEVIDQKRLLAAVEGAVLPIVALGFIKSLVDYIKPESKNNQQPQTANSEKLPGIFDDNNEQSPSTDMELPTDELLDEDDFIAENTEDNSTNIDSEGEVLIKPEIIKNKNPIEDVDEDSNDEDINQEMENYLKKGKRKGGGDDQSHAPYINN